MAGPYKIDRFVLPWVTSGGIDNKLTCVRKVVFGEEDNRQDAKDAKKNCEAYSRSDEMHQRTAGGGL